MASQPWLKTYDLQVPRTLEPYPKIPLFGLLEQAARDYPDNTALIFKPRAMKGALDGLTSGKMTYRTLNETADRLAAALAKLGVKKGDRVVIFMPNSPQFVVAYYGILKAGGVVVATNPLYAPREMENQFNYRGETIKVWIVPNWRRLAPTRPVYGDSVRVRPARSARAR
jgi:long-chain acyl-CoA synthetase